MKKIICLVFILSSVITHAQSLSMFNVDTTNFPLIQAKILALDANGKQILNLSQSDFTITENGDLRNIVSVSCPPPKPETPLSSVLMLDISGSMCGNPLQIVKDAASVWADLMTGKSDCGITAFSDNSFVIKDFTTNKTKLLSSINSVACQAGTNFDNGFLEQYNGSLAIASNGKNKRIIILISDGGANFPPNVKDIIYKANINQITIYALTIGTATPEHTRQFTEQTGGMWFDYVNTKVDAENAFRRIFAHTQNDLCTIIWQSIVTCQVAKREVEAVYSINGSKAQTSYPSPFNSTAKIVINPSSIKFKPKGVGILQDTLISITALNADFNVTKISSSNSAFTITPNNISLKNGETKQLKLSFVPPDSGYIFSIFNIENNLCNSKFFASGGYPGKKPTVITLKLIKPNGGEIFIGGTDTLISWEGVLPEEKVSLEYTIDNGIKWTKITDTASGLSYKWHIPRVSSNQCLARVTSKAVYYDDYDDVLICNQLWMKKNLDVSTYSNGDSIRYCYNRVQWDDALNRKEGAWCHFSFDYNYGKIYGKIYNWYAVSDSRGLAPLGWHVPSDSEWTEMVNCIGDTLTSGGQLKSIGTIETSTGLWYSPNTGATDLTGFSALPGGYYYGYINGLFQSLGKCAYFWSTTNSNQSYIWILSNLSNGITKILADLKCGYYVRCIRD